MCYFSRASLSIMDSDANVSCLVLMSIISIGCCTTVPRSRRRTGRFQPLSANKPPLIYSRGKDGRSSSCTKLGACRASDGWKDISNPQATRIRHADIIQVGNRYANEHCSPIAGRLIGLKDSHPYGCPCQPANRGEEGGAGDPGGAVCMKSCFPLVGSFIYPSQLGVALKLQGRKEPCTLCVAWPEQGTWFEEGIICAGLAGFGKHFGR